MGAPLRGYPAEPSADGMRSGERIGASLVKRAPKVFKHERRAPPAGEPPSGPPAGENPYDTALIMSKMGRYMATIIPPTTTPRTTIMMGSMAARRPSTAVSTSSS